MISLRILYVTSFILIILVLFLSVGSLVDPRFNPLWAEACFGLWSFVQSYILYREYVASRNREPESKDTRVRLVWLRSNIVMIITFLLLFVVFTRNMPTVSAWLMPMIMSFVVFYFCIILQAIYYVYKEISR